VRFAALGGRPQLKPVLGGGQFPNESRKIPGESNKLLTNGNIT